MAIAERLISMVAQWAKGAQTIIPNPPVPGIAYRNETVSASDMESGQSYDKVYDSARYNQRDYLITGLLQLVEQCGVMPYSSQTNYPAGGFCLGLDGVLCQAVQPSGPDNGGARPTSNASFWTRRDFAAMVQGTRKINTTAPLSGGGALTNDLTLSLNASVAATANTVLMRDSAGRSQIAAPVAAADIARKDTVDAVAGRAINTTAPLQGGGNLTASRTLSISPATASAAGSMSAADKAKLDKATPSLVNGTLVMRSSEGRIGVATPNTGNDAANKNYVDGATVAAAKKLATAQEFRTNLASPDTGSFNGTGSCSLGVKGILATGNGGSGYSNANPFIKARGRVTDAGALSHNFNVKSVTKNATGTYTVVSNVAATMAFVQIRTTTKIIASTTAVSSNSTKVTVRYSDTGALIDQQFDIMFI